MKKADIIEKLLRIITDHGYTVKESSTSYLFLKNGKIKWETNIYDGDNLTTLLCGIDSIWVVDLAETFKRGKAEAKKEIRAVLGIKEPS